jgi:hypothetical protein
MFRVLYNSAIHATQALIIRLHARISQRNPAGVELMVIRAYAQSERSRAEVRVDDGADFKGW